MAANYNNAAWFYDGLSRLVYGHALIRAQVYLLGFIPKNTKVLVVGGGTGWILEEIAKIHPSGLQITYVEVSAKMISRAKSRTTTGNRVTFINNAIENIRLPADFDVVLTPFLFDSFTPQTLEKVFGHIHLLLKSGSRWLHADFQVTEKWWQRLLLKLMLTFFKIVCKIEASKLPDTDKQFEQYGYETVAKQPFFRDFVISTVYRKT
jgi:ubiquinone/menaquinone biosynthesis C-methylase UbiE